MKAHIPRLNVGRKAPESDRQRFTNRYTNIDFGHGKEVEKETTPAPRQESTSHDTDDNDSSD